MALIGIFVISTFAAIRRATFRSCPVVVLTAKILVWNGSSFFSMRFGPSKWMMLHLGL